MVLPPEKMGCSGCCRWNYSTDMFAHSLSIREQQRVKHTIRMHDSVCMREWVHHVWCFFVFGVVQRLRFRFVKVLAKLTRERWSLARLSNDFRRWRLCNVCIHIHPICAYETYANCAARFRAAASRKVWGWISSTVGCRNFIAVRIQVTEFVWIIIHDRPEYRIFDHTPA